MTFSSLSHRQHQTGYGASDNNDTESPLPVSERFSGFSTMQHFERISSGSGSGSSSGIFLFGADPEQRASTGFLESPSVLVGPPSVDLSAPSDDPLSDKSKSTDRSSYSKSR